MRTSRQQLTVFLLLFYGSAAVDLFVPRMSNTVNTILTFAFATILYFWVREHSKENGISPPKGARMFSAVFPPLGVPYYLLKGFGVKKGSVRIAAAIAYILVLFGGYLGLVSLPLAFQPNNLEQSLQECTDIENNLIRTACYDETVKLLNLNSPELPSYYSEVYLSVTPKEERPNCSQLSELLFGIEMGGPRTYLDKLPLGFEYRNQRDGGFWGTDSVSGTTHGMQLRNMGVMWHEDKVARLIANFDVEFDFELDVHLNKIEELSNAHFEYDDSSEIYELFCDSGVTITASTSITGGFGTRKPTYSLLVNFRHPTNDQLEMDLESRRQI